MSSSIPTGNEPTDEDIARYRSENPGESFYTARENLREISYGGKPPVDG